MRLVFMGSGRFAVPSLQTLLESSHRIEALFTQPDKPAGRGHNLRMPPTKPAALGHSVPVHQPVKVRTPESVELIRSIAPECIVVVAYGQIIPKSILEIPPKGIINVHGSLLPAYRGAAPIQWSIARGETETGVTTMLMDEGLDTGPMLLKRKIAIEPDDTGGSLEEKLAPIGAHLLVETLAAWERNELIPKPQDDSLATWAPRIKKENAHIDWNLKAEEIAGGIRAFSPWPVAFFEIGGRTLKVFKSVVESPGKGEPGEILSIEPDGILVGCGSGTRLKILEVQAQGKKRMPASDFARGQRIAPGTKWG